MKRTVLFIAAILLSFSGFAISPITGTASVCAGSTSPLTDATMGGTWSSSATAVATIGSADGLLYGVAAGTATISYTDGISTATITATVNPTVTPKDSIASPGMPVCTGSRITFTSYSKYGGTSPIYSWFINGAPAGSAADTFSYIPVDGDILFSTMATNELCPSSAYAISNNITVSTATPITPVFTITSSGGITITNGNYDTLRANVVSDGSIPTYQWMHRGVIIAGATSATYFNDLFSWPMDTLSCTVTGCGGATATQQIFLIVLPEAVNNVSGTDNNVNVFPNPATNEINISSSAIIHQVAIDNLLGQTIFNADYNSRQVRVNTTDLAKGVYLIKINGGEIRKFVRQ